MKWQHYNRLRCNVWYIETLLREMESTFYKKEGIYKHVEIDLSKEQIQSINEQLKRLYSILEEIQKTFHLENEPINASRVVYINALDILETIEETWSSYMEKTSGKIDSIEEKKQIDEYLNRIITYTKHIKEIVKKR